MLHLGREWHHSLTQNVTVASICRPEVVHPAQAAHPCLPLQDPRRFHGRLQSAGEIQRPTKNMCRVISWLVCISRFRIVFLGENDNYFLQSVQRLYIVEAEIIEFLSNYHIFLQSETLVKKLAEKADGETFDIFNFITLCTLDIICGKMQTSAMSKVYLHDHFQFMYFQEEYCLHFISFLF